MDLGNTLRTHRTDLARLESYREEGRGDCVLKSLGTQEKLFTVRWLSTGTGAQRGDGTFIFADF